MINQICIKISEVILSVLALETEIKDNVICHPQKYYGSIHRLLSGVLGVVAHHNLNYKPTSGVADVFQNLEASLSLDCFFIQNFKKSSKNEQDALNQFLVWLEAKNFDSIKLSDLYELMLSLEFPIKDGAIVEDYEGEILDTIGSFYTPKDLADKCVELTLDNYILQNTGIEQFSIADKNQPQTQQVAELLKKSTYADNSCGTGSFILAILRYVDEHFSSHSDEIKKTIVLNFEAIEADSLALEIAKIEVLSKINRIDLYSEVSSNFIHGNPILGPTQTNSSFAYSDDFYYHNGLAIDPANLKNSDVILGNPPWGEVGFDLAYFCRVILPKMNEVKSQDDLERVLGGLETSHPNLFDWLLEHEEANDLAVDEIYEDKRFQNSTNGGLHTNVLFTELCDSLSTENGSVGLVLKGSTLSDSQNKRLLNLLSDRNRIQGRFDFLNTLQVFNIDKDEEFSILILGSNNSGELVRKTGLTQLAEV
ncbi:MAG: hypothetical protein ACJATS_002289 [Psychroserpens sp.]|jgi:hypothetical protein